MERCAAAGGQYGSSAGGDSISSRYRKRSSEREVETLQSTDPSCDSAGSFCHRAGDGAFVAWGKPRLLAGKIYFCDHIFAR